MTARRRSSPSTRWLWVATISLGVSVAGMWVGRTLEQFHAKTIVLNWIAAAGGGLLLVTLIAGVVGVRKSKAENRAALARAQARLEAKRAAKRHDSPAGRARHAAGVGALAVAGAIAAVVGVRKRAARRD